MKVLFSRLALAAFVAIGVQGPAFAHHPIGGKLPATFIDGLLSGIGHPIIGLDHFAAIVGVGILAAIAARGVAPLLVFSAALFAGVCLHVGKANLPAGELLVGLSTLAIGSLVMLRHGMRPAIVIALFAVAGLVHGYALGEAIVGAEASPLISYLAGILVIQTVVSLVAYLAVRRLSRPLTFAVGALVALVGGVTAAAAALT